MHVYIYLSLYIYIYIYIFIYFFIYFIGRALRACGVKDRGLRRKASGRGHLGRKQLLCYLTRYYIIVVIYHYADLIGPQSLRGQKASGRGGVVVVVVVVAMIIMIIMIMMINKRTPG